LLPRLLVFEDEHNLYALPQGTFLTTNREGAPKHISSITTLAQWHQFWGIVGSTSQVGTPVYQGGDVYARALKDPAHLSPADFRLAAGSPGKGTGQGSKDPGADVDKIEPGRPYEEWKKSPDYQRWRKEADALKVGGGN
jgi:hypothetical protein